ncbi:MAG: MBL fold metallo-hydrolase, partial [Firmicutes bacterium]|nr:MBL fold metallo-hydrolase [Bacillota bacterium]
INEWPQFEPTILYGGYPSKALKNKFLMAKATPYTDIAEMDMPEGMEIFSLPGHYIDMIGVKTPDDVYFMADCVSSQNILDKYHVGFIYDVKAYLETLDKIEDWTGTKFVPAHAPACDDMKELCRINREKVLEIIEVIKEKCKEPVITEELIKQMFDHYNLAMDFNQYVLVGSTLRSYLSYMADEGMLTYEFADNYLKWKS